MTSTFELLFLFLFILLVFPNVSPAKVFLFILILTYIIVYSMLLFTLFSNAHAKSRGCNSLPCQNRRWVPCLQTYAKRSLRIDIYMYTYFFFTVEAG